MIEQTRTTTMLHFECGTCGLQATIVATEVGKLAWLDHMATHAVPELYGAWTWQVQQLPFADELPIR